MKKIVHIDLNAFFAQAEILRNPALAGKPVAVGGDFRRGVVSTASYEARAFGIHSGMPIGQAKRLCRDLIIVSGDYSYYSRLSEGFFGYLRTRFPLLEQASIDEAYIDATDFLSEGDDKARLFDLQMDLYRMTSLKCSIGMGSNRFLAKMGSDYKKPLGLTLIGPENLRQILWPLPIAKMYGIGVKTAPRLEDAGIKTIGDLATTANPEVKALLGNGFGYFQSEANGFGDDTIDTAAFVPKSISAERTFSDDTGSEDEIRAMIRHCCQDVAQELKDYGMAATSLSLKLRTPDFVTKSRRTTLEKPVSTKESLTFAAISLFERIYQGQLLRLIGVGVEKVVIVKTIDGQSPESLAAQKLLNSINDAFGKEGMVFMGSAMKEEKKNDDSGSH